MKNTFFSVEIDRGNGFEKSENLNIEEVTEEPIYEIELPIDACGVRVVMPHGSCLIYVKHMEGYHDGNASDGLWYEMAFETDGIRLGHNLFLLEKDGAMMTAKDFRFHTTKLRVAFEIINLSFEMTEKMAHSAARLIHERDVLDEKWKYQVQVYDEKVSEVVGLEADKVALNQAIEELKGEAAFWKNHYDQMENSVSWKLTAPVRSVNASLHAMKNRAPLRQKKKAYRARVREIGAEAAKKELFREYVGSYVDYLQAIDVWKHVPENAYLRSAIIRAETAASSNAGAEPNAGVNLNTGVGSSTGAEQNSNAGNFDKSFAILTQVQNVSETEVFTLVNFLMNQTYDAFRIYILDTSDKEHRLSSQILDWLASLDARIVVRHALFVNLEQADIETRNALLKTFLPIVTEDYVSVIEADAVLDVRTLEICARALASRKSEFLYTDSDRFTSDITDAEDPQFKPDYSPDFLRSCNYIRGFWCAKRELFELDFEHEELMGNHGYGLLLHLTEKALSGADEKADCKRQKGTAADCKVPQEAAADSKERSKAVQERSILHIPMKLYYEKKKTLSGAVQTLEAERGALALSQHLERCQLDRNSCTVEIIDREACLYHVRYPLTQKPLVSVLIPNKDHVDDLKRCIDSVIKKTTYQPYEIVVVENNSTQKETFDFYERLTHDYEPEVHHNVSMTAGLYATASIHPGDGHASASSETGMTGGESGQECEMCTYRPEIRVVEWKDQFNYSAINNFGMQYAQGDYVMLLNNDIEVITPTWLEEMMMYALRADVGAVGAKLYYMDDTVQHAGVIIGLGGVAAHSHKDYKRTSAGYMNRLRVVQNLSAVTAACLLMRKSVYEEIGGMHEGYQVAFNDADFCMRIRDKGYLIVFTPFAELYHDESKSRGVEDTEEKAERFESEVVRFKSEWPQILDAGDPYYNVNLTSAREDFSVKA